MLKRKSSWRFLDAETGLWRLCGVSNVAEANRWNRDRASGLTLVINRPPDKVSCGFRVWELSEDETFVISLGQGARILDTRVFASATARVTMISVLQGSTVVMHERIQSTGDVMRIEEVRVPIAEHERHLAWVTAVWEAQGLMAVAVEVLDADAA